MKGVALGNGYCPFFIWRKDVMKLAWFLMVAGAGMILQAVAIIFVGLNPPNLWILLCGLCVGVGLGYYPAYIGFKRRKVLLNEKVKA